MNREPSSSFVKQAAILAAASLFVRFIGFLYRLPITGLIKDEGNAYYAQAFNIYTLALIVSASGLPAAISRLVSERIELKQFRNAHEVFKVSLWVALGLGMAGSLFLALGARWLAGVSRSPESVYAIWAVSPTILVVSVMAVFRGYFQGMRNAVPTALSQVFEQIFNAAFSLILAHRLYNPDHLEYAAAGSTAGTGIGALAGLLVVAGLYTLVARPLKARAARDRNTRSREPRGQLAWVILKTALPIIVGSAVFAIANIIDQAMIDWRLVESAAFTADEIDALSGQFAGKYILLTTLPVSISTALATAVIPSITASYVTRNRKAVKSKINMALRLSMALSIPAAVGLGVLSGPILTLLFPTASGGALLLQCGVISIIFLALTQIVTGILQGLGQVNLPVAGAVCGLAVKIPINYFLIANPAYNVLGAVISTCVCYLVAGAVDVFFLWRHTRILPDLGGAFIKPLMASAAMGLACYVSYHAFQFLSGVNALSTLLAITVGVCAYVMFMVLIQGFRQEDIATLPMGEKIADALFK